MEGGRYSLQQLFADGGIFMYPLLLCSMLALGVIIAKAYTLWAAQRKSRRILEVVRDLGEQGRIDEAIEVTGSTPGPVAAILHSGLRRLRDQKPVTREIEKAVKTTGRIELGFLERGLVLLATVASVAPLIGFLGTVAGMISAFGAIAAAGDLEPSLVARGIKIALITTAAGLAVAIPVNIAYNYFVTRIDRLILEMEKGAASVLELVWRRESAEGAASSGK